MKEGARRGKEVGSRLERLYDMTCYASFSPVRSDLVWFMFID